MATNQPANVAENPDDVMRRFLPEMKRVVNIEDLILYLMSENAIGDDDTPRLTVSGQLSKTQVLVNLQQIIATRGTTEQFLKALERSSDDHTGHKELFTKMVAERRRRKSVSSQRSISSTLGSFTSRTPLIQESDHDEADTVPSSPKAPLTMVATATHVSSMSQSPQTTSAPPSNAGREETVSTATTGRVNPPKKSSGVQQQGKKSFWIGWLSGGLCAIALTLAALAITTIVYGSLGVEGKDECGFSDVRVSAFGVSSGALMLWIVIFSILVIALYVSYHVYFLDQDCCSIALRLLAVLAILFVLGVVANVLFSFISVVKVVYRDYPQWDPSSTGCSSPAFFSAFSYVTVEFILIGILIILLFVLLCYCCRCHQE